MFVTARRNSSPLTSRAYAGPPSCVRARRTARTGDVSVAPGPACFCIRSNLPIVVPSLRRPSYVVDLLVLWSAENLSWIGGGELNPIRAPFQADAAHARSN